MQEYVIDLYRHFLFRFFWAMSKVMYLVILLSFCYLTEDYMVFAYFAVLCAGGNLAASNIRNLECPSYEFYLIDYGCGKFNKKVHIME